MGCFNGAFAQTGSLSIEFSEAVVRQTDPCPKAPGFDLERLAAATTEDPESGDSSLDLQQVFLSPPLFLSEDQSLLVDQTQLS
jgi:hypothetical protein